MKKFFKTSLAQALGALIYIALVATLMTNGEKLFGQIEKTIFGPIMMLLLFVLSATITASLVLGRPLLMYLDGNKKEALKHFGCTVLWLFGFFVVVFIINIILG